MKKKILLAIGIAGAFAVQPRTDAHADFRIGIEIPGGLGINFESRPDFIYMDDYGFAVSYGGPHDVIFYGNTYFVFRDGYWYRAYDYRGPWGRISNYELPGPIRRHGWNEIRKHRDIEYRRHDRGYWDNRFRQDRERRGEQDDRRGPQGSGDRRGFDDRRGPSGPQGADDRRGSDDRRGPAGQQPQQPQQAPQRGGPTQQLQLQPQAPQPAPQRGPAQQPQAPQPAPQRGPAQQPQAPDQNRKPEQRDRRNDRRDERRDQDESPRNRWEQQERR